MYIYIWWKQCAWKPLKKMKTREERNRDVTAAELDTCMANHVTEIVRNILEAITLTRATYTHA